MHYVLVRTSDIYWQRALECACVRGGDNNAMRTIPRTADTQDEQRHWTRFLVRKKERREMKGGGTEGTHFFNLGFSFFFIYPYVPAEIVPGGRTCTCIAAIALKKRLLQQVLFDAHGKIMRNASSQESCYHLLPTIILYPVHEQISVPFNSSCFYLVVEKWEISIDLSRD